MIQLMMPKELSTTAQGSRPKTKKELTRLLSRLGCRVICNKVDFRRDDCTDWYWTSGEPILTAERGWLRFELICTGDLKIYGRRVSFVFTPGRIVAGKLTAHLKKTGQWDNNNWFEILVNNTMTGESDSEEDVNYSLRDAVANFVAQCKAPLFPTTQH